MTPYDGLANRCFQPLSDDSIRTYDDPQNILVSGLVSIVESEPDLRHLIESWADLPEPLREAIVTLVDTSKP